MYRVIKRDNSIVDFNLSKIKDAMSLAFQSRQKPCHPDVLDLLALKVTADFSSKVKDELVNVRTVLSPFSFKPAMQMSQRHIFSIDANAKSCAT